MSEPFEMERDLRCQRGLRFIYRADFDPVALADALDAAYDGMVVRHVETLGAVRTERVIVQFQVEFRVGERPGEVSLTHRVSAAPDTRAASHRVLEHALRHLAADRPAA